ncbi:MAG: 3-deoxy-7-phosphoheptulonate synthase, partial [Candidatus Saganbacteria bacterium]|nr:3-deoxy-7-phosphoheptulonate synthase [Candidatus Saganbacteria bacterium]
MIIVMHPNATEAQINQVAGKLKQHGFGVHLSKGVERTIIGAIGDKSTLELETIQMLPGVSEIVHVSKPFKLVSREFHPLDSVVKVGSIKIGAKHPIVIMAGPCAVEGK